MPRDPRQPNLIEPPSRTILDVVQEGLRGFKYRHRARLARRKLDNEKKLKVQRAKRKRGMVQKPLHLEEEETKMRILKVTYRSIQEQPCGVLNPSGLKLPGLRPVEVFAKGDKWYLREIETPRRVRYEKLGGFVTAQAAMDATLTNFGAMREAWQMWGTPPQSPMQARDHKPAERIIGWHEITLLPNNQIGWKEPEDFTHIMRTGPGFNVDGNAPTFTATCNEQLPGKYFISTKANVKPTCTTCAEVWEKEYQGK